MPSGEHPERSTAIPILDPEKEFDRVYHNYLMNAIAAAGLCKNMRFYNNPERTQLQKSDGERYEHTRGFPMLAGVAQGCSLSPLLLLFLPVAEYCFYMELIYHLVGSGKTPATHFTFAAG